MQQTYNQFLPLFYPSQSWKMTGPHWVHPTGQLHFTTVTVADITTGLAPAATCCVGKGPGASKKWGIPICVYF